MAKTGMEAVIEKSSAAGKGRKPLMRRKGAPGMAIMIAIGKPKPKMEDKMEDKMDAEDNSPSMKEELDASKGEGLSKAEKIAALEEKIGYLKAELALLQDDMDESEDDSEDSEDEDEYEDED
jgi:hypothetical protein